jgi:hypothetical protein
MLRAERAAIDADIARLEFAARRAERVPTEEDFRLLIDNLEEVLRPASSGQISADAGDFRRLLELLTGGRMIVEQIGERRACRGWLRVRIRLHLVETCAARLDLAVAATPPGKEIAVDIREPRIAEAQVESVSGRRRRRTSAARSSRGGRF